MKDIGSCWEDHNLLIADNVWMRGSLSVPDPLTPSVRAANHRLSRGGSGSKASSKDIGIGLLGFSYPVHRDATKYFSKHTNVWTPYTLHTEVTSLPPSTVKLVF